MKDTGKGGDSTEKKICELKTEDLSRCLELLKKAMNLEYASYLHSCVRCGLCAESCHYFLEDRETASIPAYKLRLVADVFRRYFSLTGRLFPALSGAKNLDKEMVREWIDSLYGRCTLCGRCALNCSVGINIPRLILAGRGVLSSLGIIPDGLDSTIRLAVESGNSMGISLDDWLETLEWLEEELRMETGDAEASIPVDEKGEGILYVINPREAKFFPLSILAAAKIFHFAGESWTLSSRCFDVTNYGYYAGYTEASSLLSGRVMAEGEKLGVRTLVLAECGHGFNAQRWEAPEWIGKKPGFRIKSILQVVADYIREGRIKLDPSRVTGTVTLHDPCNLVRLGGIVEDQRFILKNAVSRFIEMHPNREKNYCCGGGGGQLAMTRFKDRRLRAGGRKAAQIQKTGAGIVVTPCHNCIDQITELNRHHKLGVQVKTVCEVVADALVSGKNESGKGK